jgi:hypothetical protein
MSDDDFDSFAFDEEALQAIDSISNLANSSSVPSATSSRSVPSTARPKPPAPSSLHKSALAASSSRSKAPPRPAGRSASSSHSNVVQLPSSDEGEGDDDEFPDDFPYDEVEEIPPPPTSKAALSLRSKSTPSNPSAASSSRLPQPNAQSGPSRSFSSSGTSSANLRQMDLFGNRIQPEEDGDDAMQGSGLVRAEGKKWDMTRYAATGYKMKIKPKTSDGDDEEEAEEEEDDEGEGFEQFPAPDARRKSSRYLLKLPCSRIADRTLFDCSDPT